MALAGVLAAVALVVGCSSDDDTPSSHADERSPDGDSGEQKRPSGANGQAAPQGGARQTTPRPTAPRLREARCPASAPPGCRSASGRILYVERVDPDGDGDAHFVLASRESITAPGLSVIDVRRDLRPRPLPRPGDRISAAGPVYRGSYGQRQIEAVVVHSTR